MENKVRLNYLDIAKGMAISMIVLGHLFKSGSIMKLIFAFHVVLFFMISGYLLKFKDVNALSKKSINSRIRSVVIPYISFSLIYIIGDFIISKFDVSNLMWDSIYTLMLIPRSALWFLPAFFIGEMLFLLILRFKNNYVKLVLIIGCFAIPYGVTFIRYNFIILVIARALIACGFIGIGYYTKDIIDKISIRQALILFVISFVMAQLNVSVDLYSLVIGNIIMYVLTGFIASASVIVLCKKMHTNRVLEFLGANSIIIMSTHQLILKSSNIFIENNFIILLIIVILEYPIIKIIDNYVPCILGRFKKKEKYIEEVAVD